MDGQFSNLTSSHYFLTPPIRPPAIEPTTKSIGAPIMYANILPLDLVCYNIRYNAGRL